VTSKPKTPASIPAHSSGTRRGFALVATLMLMVLLALLALGLLSLSSITLRASSRNDAMAQAQANARLALMMAIGQLQTEMGPDSRISAAHDAGSASSGGSPHWTAVYDAWQVPEDPAIEETPQSRAPTFRAWLVSGAGANAGTGEQVILAGPRSLGSSSKPEDVIRVPMQDVTTGDQLGKIAWWTSDEGMKAKINAGPDTAPSPEPMYDTQSARQVGHQVVGELEDFEWLPSQRAKTVSNDSVDLAAGLEEPGLGSVNHHVTVHSAGVLADVRTGRLRRDLSNLLTRPIGELEDKPLYLYGGRMNRFEISEDGAVSNAQGIPATSGSGGNTWGINLEELALFHNIHRQISESDGEPMLLTETTPDSLSQDRFYMYGKPSIDAMQFLLSLVAVPDGQNADGDDVYKMQMMLDGMVALSNPNDVRLRFPPGLVKSVLLLSFPYDMKLDINGDGASRSATSPTARRVFTGFIEGGFGGLPADGFDLEPGEAAAFGSTDATGFNLNLRRGFDPSGGVKMTSWNLQADQLKADDQIDFELLKVISARNGSNSNIYFQAWHNNNARIFESAVISQGPNPDGEPLDLLLPEKILPPQVLPVSDFIDEPKPIMLFSILKNVEQSSSQANPDALASRPLLLDESARVGRAILRYGDVPRDLQSTQLLFTAEPLNYQFRTLAAGAGGRSVYHGGGRQPGNGGNFQVIKRRIPLVPPLSLGAFENAIASGFSSHFGDSNNAYLRIGSGSDPSTTALTGMGSGSTMSPKVIGNSWTTPFVNSDQTLEVSGSFEATDDSWMANTALWDSWFLSGIVDTSDLPASVWMTDRRTAREQFMEFANNSKRLRNQRFLFHPRTSAEQAASELFDADDLKPSAINSLPKHLLIDGAFNVNSTSELAWNAFLASVRDQEILIAGADDPQQFLNPFGTLGYALDNATSGTAGDWAGLRDLTNIEISGLATAIADEVRDRGPFLSMADFLNRRPDSDKTEHRALGALQAAIDKSGLNDRFSGAGRELTPGDFMTLSGAANVAEEPVPSRANGAAGHLSQANLLTALGPQIAVRSDTFVIRTYGDVRDASDKIIAKAWCEAVVQRVPEYVDPADAPEAQDGWPTSANTLAPANVLFGRRLEIVSFRWLDSSETADS